MTNVALEDVTDTRVRAAALRQEVKLLEQTLQEFQARRRADASLGLDCRPHAVKELQLETDIRGLHEELARLELRICQYDLAAGEQKLGDCNLRLRDALTRSLKALHGFSLQDARTARGACEQADLQLTGDRSNLRRLMAALSDPLGGVSALPPPVLVDEVAMELLQRLERACSAIDAAQAFAAEVGIR